MTQHQTAHYLKGVAISRMGTGPVPWGVVSLRFVPPLKREVQKNDPAIFEISVRSESEAG